MSGPPGAGKSTLAPPIAATLGLPLLTKDTIKESLHDALGDLDPDLLVSSRLLGGAAMELLWRLAAECPAVVIEANFRTRSEYERAKVRSLCEHPVEVHCCVPEAVAATRYAERGAGDDHHPVHVARTRPPADYTEFSEPFGLGTLIEVDTTRPVDAAAVASRVQAALMPG